MKGNRKAEARSTSARRAIYYTDGNELDRAYEAIGEAWFQKMEEENFGIYAALLGYIAGVADGKRAERAKQRIRQTRGE